MNVEKKLAENYSCVKCRGKSAHVHSVVLPLARIMAIFSGQFSPKFYVVSCVLCGYSEFYDARVYAVQPEDVTESEPLLREN